MYTYRSTMAKPLSFSISVILLFSIATAKVLKDTSGKVSLNYESSNNGINIELLRDRQFQLHGSIGKGIDFRRISSCIGESSCQLNNGIDLIITPIQYGFNISWEADGVDLIFEDCINLNSENTTWWGGPERLYQVWPLDDMVINRSEPYTIRKTDNHAVAERYWLNSNGVYIFLDDIVPLWVDQNNQNADQVCFVAEAKSPYINRWRNVLSYVITALDDPKIAHLDAVKKYLGKPEKYPNEKMISEPIWTTWAKYKKPITDDIILEFAEDIRSHGYQGGQLEIDDAWEKCYGAQEFDPAKFPNITNVVKQLHEDNWRVTLWIHPFVDDDCQNNSLIGQSLNYFARNTTGQTNASWWNTENSHQIDFTNPKAAEWWSARVRKIHDEVGIDSFKFDAGEANYMNQPPVYEDVEHTPNILTQRYIEACVAFGDLIEVRSTFRGQQYGEFIRMQDKDSSWDLQNGLATLITTLLQMNINGYPMLLPDMIGGNAYNGLSPSGDLIIRWTAANVFMPSMQFSFLPWDFKDSVSYDIDGIAKKFIDLHEQYSPNIIKAMKKCIQDGTPVNPPIWWVDPSDVTAHRVDNEFLLGEDILVAPVIVEGATSRDIYLPRGQWKDGNNGTVYEGPTTLRSYYAPIDVLPYFLKQ